MRTIMVGDCASDRIYQLSDPDAPNEAELEYSVARVLSCVYPDFRCVIFGGGFKYDDRVFRPDLAMIARDFSHWFIIEVEKVSHSFTDHVLPQVRAFRYGTPQPDCADILAARLEISHGQAATLLDYVPRTVAVVANKRDLRWEIALDSHNIQLLAVSSFKSLNGVAAIEVDGVLEVIEESLGFGMYSVADRSLRFLNTLKIPEGRVQINDPLGTIAFWTVVHTQRVTWITKEVGQPD